MDKKILYAAIRQQYQSGANGIPLSEFYGCRSSDAERI